MSRDLNKQHLSPAKRRSPNSAWLRALERTAAIARDPQNILPVAIEQLSDRFGDTPALLSQSTTLGYRALEELSNRYSRWALATGLQPGQCVCLLMPNRPEYVPIWLGISRVGGVVSLLNTNLRGRALAYCIELVRPQHVIVDAELNHVLRALRTDIASEVRIWVHGDGSADMARIDMEIPGYAPERLAGAERRLPALSDRALFIYTSGTTGYPKAASVSHHRVMMWSHWFAGIMDIQPGDRMYNALPLYHSVGGVVAVGPLLVSGASVAIRDKFSTSNFWQDIRQWDCTLFQYIGELCRYLLNAPFHPEETMHRLRLCCGNGLRADIWNRFKERFNIPQILEFYAATEGNFSLINVEGKVGSVGRIPPFLGHRFPAAIIRFDALKEEPLRNEEGFCVRCGANETGEAIGKIADPGGNLVSRFEGYSSSEETEKKILRDVFEIGDAWFRTGDLMRIDEQGYFYFVDRIGDTFRWKGENVAASEVVESLRSIPGIKDAIVYGASLPGYDGRAGMAAIVVDERFDLRTLPDHLAGSLPQYARPIFLRICDRIETTGTFKYKKTELVKEGYGLRATSDLVYFYDSNRREFVHLNQTLYNRIQMGLIRL